MKVKISRKILELTNPTEEKIQKQLYREASIDVDHVDHVIEIGDDQTVDQLKHHEEWGASFPGTPMEHRVFSGFLELDGDDLIKEFIDDDDVVYLDVLLPTQGKKQTGPLQEDGWLIVKGEKYPNSALFRVLPLYSQVYMNGQW